MNYPYERHCHLQFVIDRLTRYIRSFPPFKMSASRYVTPMKSGMRSQQLVNSSISKGDRTLFLSDCESGVHDGVIAIARTYDSIEVLHLTSPDRRKRSTESKAYKTCVADGLLEDSTKSLLMLCPICITHWRRL